MAISFTETLREQTNALIELFPTPIELVRPAKLISDGAGGFVKDGEDRTFPERNRYFFEAEDVTKIPMFSALENKGEQFVEGWMVIGPYGDDIQTGDYFFLNNVKYTITRVNADQSYQVKAHVGTELRVFVP